jgi:hypothetical protein
LRYREPAMFGWMVLASGWLTARLGGGNSPAPAT